MTELRDNPNEWTRDLVPAPPFDVFAYQKELDKITGLSRGQSIVKLFWGGIETERKFTDWANGVPIESALEPKFYTLRNHPLLLDKEKIPVKRWILAQRTEPEQYGYGQDLTFTDEYDNVNLLAEKPKEGYYDAYIYIGDHSECPSNCCEKVMCFGDYKEPSIDELLLVTQHVYNAARDRVTNPYAQLSDADLQRITKERADEQKAVRDKQDQDFDLQSKDWFKTHGHRITSDDPSVLKHGKYHFVTT